MNTSQFENWFAPSVATVTGDSGGRPLVVFHGTTVGDIEKDGDFYFFASSEKEAARYAPRDEDGAKVIRAILRLERPLIIETELQPAEAWDTEGALYVERARAGSHDSIITVQTSTGDKNFMVFDAAQFMRADALPDTSETGNNGEIAAVNQDIRFSMPETTPSVAQLQAQLAAIEKKYEPLRKQSSVRGPEWDAVSKEAAAVRQQLFELTGDAYGNPKVKLRRPADEALEAEYLSPDDVPVDVRAWIEKNANLLTSDATDAVRWGRIRDTLDDDRYPEGDLTIYRAVSNGDEIRAGDWVTTDRAYAEEHLAKHLKGKGSVLEESVDGRDVLVSPTGNDEEAIFAPRHLSGPKAADYGLPLASTKPAAPDDWARALPRAGASVDGRMVRSHVPNRSSIEASISNSEVLSGVRAIPLAAFNYTPGKPDQRTLNLAAQIEESGELNPLIVGIDAEGPYVIEGGHRLDALYVLGALELPAEVVIDLDEFADKPTAPDKLATPAFKNWFGPSVITENGQAGGKPLPVYHGTVADFSTPRLNGAGLFFVTPDRDSVSEFADNRYGSQVMPMYASIKNPFNASDKDAVDRVISEGRAAGWITGNTATLSYASGSAQIAVSLLRAGDYVAIESKEVVEAIKKLGYDGIKIVERGMTNFAVFDPEQIKSAIGNNGDFDADHQDIRFSVPDDEDVQPEHPAP